MQRPKAAFCEYIALELDEVADYWALADLSKERGRGTASLRAKRGNPVLKMARSVRARKVPAMATGSRRRPWLLAMTPYEARYKNLSLTGQPRELLAQHIDLLAQGFNIIQ